MKHLILFFLLSIYANAIYLPKCNKNNKEIFFIKNIKDWQHINDKDKRIFCVKPNNYENLGKVIINSSGTKEKPRYLLLDNGNNLHPAKLNDKELAKYLLSFQNSSYWVIDRQSYKNNKNPFFRNKIKNSHNLIFNRLYFKNTSSVFVIYTNSNDITIQNSYFLKDKWSLKEKNFHDTAAINLICRNLNESIKNIKIKNNEIVNYVDAIQSVRYANAYNKNAQIDFQGLKIVNNLLYVTPSFYSDCKGNLNLNGKCSFSENAIDLKGGSKNINNPIIIKNNTIFGYRKADNSYSNLADPGSGIVFHYDVNNIFIENNLIFNSYIGITAGAPMKNRVALSNTEIKNNIFSNIKYYAINLHGSLKAIFDGAKNIDIQNNTFYKSNAPVIKLYNTDKIKIENNYFLESKPFWIPDFFKFPQYKKYKNENLNIFNNKFYKTKISIPTFAKNSNNQVIKSFNINSIQKEIIIKKFTNNPKKAYLLGGKK